MEYYCLKYKHKWLCPPTNDNLNCEDCLYSTLQNPEEGFGKHRFP